MSKFGAVLLSVGALAFLAAPATAQDGEKETLVITQHPRMVTAQTVKAIQGGVRYLVRMQRGDGSWTAGGSGGGYPAAMTSLAAMALASAGHTPTRGRYASQVRKGVMWLIKNQNARGLIAGPGEMRNMYGHGFAMLFLGTIYGNTADRRLQKQIHACLKKAVDLTIKAQSTQGGWYYSPDSRTDEGSVTVTQMQGLRSARNAGVNVPETVMKKSTNYLKICQNGDGGISYSARSRGSSRPAISAAGVACMYSAGAYDSPIALKMLEYCKTKFRNAPYSGSFFFYTNWYWTQVMYQTGEKEWNKFYPKLRQLVLTQHRSGDSWNGNGFGGGTGPVYGTSLAVMMLAMPYKNLPIYHR